MTHGRPNAAASGGWRTSAKAMPRGQLVSRMLIAVTISRPANQSVVIFVSTMLRSTAPQPLTRRPAKAPDEEATRKSYHNAGEHMDTNQSADLDQSNCKFLLEERGCGSDSLELKAKGCSRDEHQGQYVPAVCKHGSSRAGLIWKVPRERPPARCVKIAYSE